MEFVNDLGKSLDSVLENKTTSLVISLVLCLYAGLAAPAPSCATAPWCADSV